MEELTQACSLCMVMKPKTDYTHRKRECKECRNEKRKQFYIANKERIKEESRQRKAKYREEHKGKITCECGALICEYKIQRHKESYRYILWVD